MYDFVFISLITCANIIDVVEIWREYAGVEGIDLTPQLVIPNKELEETQAMLLVDENITTCVDIKSCLNTGN